MSPTTRSGLGSQSNVPGQRELASAWSRFALLLLLASTIALAACKSSDDSDAGSADSGSPGDGDGDGNGPGDGDGDGDLDASTDAGDGDGSSPDGSHAACEEPSDCPSPNNACLEATCEGGHCDSRPIAEGLSLADQTEGDCKTSVCDGEGGVVDEDDDSDVEDDGNACTVDACDNGAVTHDPTNSGSTCEADGGTVCDGDGECVECAEPADCESNVCQNNECRPELCGNGELDPDESDIDCGGSCGGCEPEQMCVDDEDCIGLDCTSDVCVPNCNDGVKNNTEADTDCGPGCLVACAINDSCENDIDCTSEFCHPTTGLCTEPSCSDEILNGDEVEEDCGGPDCDPCSGICTLNSQCVSGICYGNACVENVNGCTVANSMDLRTGNPTVTINFGGATGNNYDPRCIRVSASTQVTFMGAFSGHPLVGGVVVSGDKVPLGSGPLFPTTNTGTSKVVTLSSAGVTVPFYCDFHGPSGMNGAIFVE